MTLEQIEAALNQRLATLNLDPEAAFADYLEVYQVLAQVKQAQHLEFIASVVDGIGKDMAAMKLSDEFEGDDENAYYQRKEREAQEQQALRDSAAFEQGLYDEGLL